jgi:heterodisulfide reductase subunit C
MKTMEQHFGFKLFAQRDIDLNASNPCNTDSNLWQTCMQCGSCSASCTTSTAKTDLRKAIILMQRGLADQAQKALDNCLFCGKCTFVCPRGISTRHVISTIRKVQVSH